MILKKHFTNKSYIFTIMVASVLVILISLFIVSGKVYATQQTPDYIIYGDKQYISPIYFLEFYLQKNPDKRKLLDGVDSSWTASSCGRFTYAPIDKTPPSDLRRGYIATYAVINGELILKNMEDWNKNNILNKFLTISKSNDSVFKINWFTDLIVFPNGRLIHNEYYFNAYECQLVLEFKDGNLISESYMDYMTYFRTYYKKHYEMDGIMKEFLELGNEPLEERYQRVLKKLKYLDSNTQNCNGKRNKRY